MSDPVVLTPVMILGAMERHSAELANALRSATDPMTVNVEAVREHIGRLEPLLASLQQMQGEFRAAQNPAPPLPPVVPPKAANGNAAAAEGSEAVN